MTTCHITYRLLRLRAACDAEWLDDARTLKGHAKNVERPDGDSSVFSMQLSWHIWDGKFGDKAIQSPVTAGGNAVQTGSRCKIGQFGLYAETVVWTSSPDHCLPEEQVVGSTTYSQTSIQACGPPP